MTDPSVLLLSCGSWHLPQTAKAFSERGALAGLWITLGNHAGIPANKYRRAWPFQAAMFPLYFCVPQILAERAFFAFFSLWKAWVARQPISLFQVSEATMGFGTEPFYCAERD